jgi:hypothetical protein
MTIFERFAFYPAAALGFDVIIAVALLGMALLANVMAMRSRFQ